METVTWIIVIEYYNGPVTLSELLFGKSMAKLFNQSFPLCDRPAQCLTDFTARGLAVAKHTQTLQKPSVCVCYLCLVTLAHRRRFASTCHYSSWGLEFLHVWWMLGGFMKRNTQTFQYFQRRKALGAPSRSHQLISEGKSRKRKVAFVHFDEANVSITWLKLTPFLVIILR